MRTLTIIILMAALATTTAHAQIRDLKHQAPATMSSGGKCKRPKKPKLPAKPGPGESRGDRDGRVWYRIPRPPRPTIGRPNGGLQP